MLMQNFGVTNKEYYGLSYKLDVPGKRSTLANLL